MMYLKLHSFVIKMCDIRYILTYKYIFTCFWHGEGGPEVAHWLRCCATNRKVAGLIPAGVIGIFH